MKGFVYKLLLLALTMQTIQPLFAAEEKRSFLDRINIFKKRKPKEVPATPPPAPKKKATKTTPVKKEIPIPDDALVDDQGNKQPPEVEGFFEKTASPKTIYNKTNKTAYTLTNGKWIPSDLEGNVTPVGINGVFQQTNDPRIIINKNNNTAYKLNNGKWIAGVYEDGLFAMRAEKLEEVAPKNLATTPTTTIIPTPELKAEPVPAASNPDDPSEFVGPPEKIDYYKTIYKVTYPDPEEVERLRKKREEQQYEIYGYGGAGVVLLTVGARVLVRRFEQNRRRNERLAQSPLSYYPVDHITRLRPRDYENLGSTPLLNAQRSNTDRRIHLSECRMRLRR